MIHAVGANKANPNGGVYSYIANLSYSLNDLQFYSYNEFFKFFNNIQDGDTVFLNVPKPSLPFLILSKIKFNKKISIVYCGHGLAYRNHKGIKKVVVKFCEYLISKLSDKIIVLNKKHMKKYLSWNESSNLIPTCLRPIEFTNNTNKQIGSAISWVAVGSVDNNKNPKLFLEISRVIKGLFPRDTFTWIGDGPLFKNFDVESLKTEGIFFIGSMDNKLVRKKLREHDIYICTSISEVLPITILEAVESKCIILVRNYLNSDDITSRFSSAVSFKNSNQVLELRKNIDKLQGLRKAAINEASNISESYVTYIKQMKKVLDV